jgi:archaellin
MNNQANLGISSVIILISFILISVTAFSVLSNDTTEGTSEEEIQEIIDDTLDEITKYLQITDKIGKFYGPPQQQEIQKIALMVKPIFSNEIDISEITIKITDGNSIKILSYSGVAQPIDTNHLFEHPIWNDLNENTFGLISTHDKDNSISDYSVLNKNTDMAYIVISLSPDFFMKKGDTLFVQLFLSSGIIKTMSLEAPLPMRAIASFD